MATTVRAHITGTVWKILVKVGDEVEEEDVLTILESMKMESAASARRQASVTDGLKTSFQRVEKIAGQGCNDAL